MGLRSLTENTETQEKRAATQGRPYIVNPVGATLCGRPNSLSVPLCEIKIIPAAYRKPPV